MLGELATSRTVGRIRLARAARLSPDAAGLLEAVAVVPPHVELWLLEALAGDVADRLDECLTSGMLVVGPAGRAGRDGAADPRHGWGARAANIGNSRREDGGSLLM